MTPGERWQRGRRVDLRASEFDALFRAVSNWGRWEERPEMGALHHLTADRVAAATRRVRSGVTVALGRLRTLAARLVPLAAALSAVLLLTISLGVLAVLRGRWLRR